MQGYKLCRSAETYLYRRVCLSLKVDFEKISRDTHELLNGGTSKSANVSSV